jgi:two-component system sensor histidine kinase CiaH
MRYSIGSTTTRLAFSYLAIIMLMSIGFSLIFFNTSSYQLGRQLPPDSWLHQGASNMNKPSSTQSQDGDDYPDSQDDIGEFLHDRIDQGRTALKQRLLYLNLGALVVGGALSYVLARRTLRPIEEAMEAQVRFVNDASHELRTPITAIKTSNDVALRNPKLTLAQAKQLIHQNGEDLERLKHLSEGLLALAKHDQPAVMLEPVDLQGLVSQAMTQVVPQALAKHILVHDEAADIQVMGDKAALTQVLVILLDNAVKYSPPKSNVHIKSRLKGKYAYLDVADEGPGIRASDIPHLFRRFYRADHSRAAGDRGGYGLGLSIAQRIMKSHDSAVTVTSRLGQGSTFTIKLALAAPVRPTH